MAKKQTPGYILAKSLTLGQIATVFDAIFAGTEYSQFMDELKQTDPDTAGMIESALRGDRKKAPKGSKARGARNTGDKRTLDYWDALWRQWGKLVSELGDEGGRYAVQEEHWEPPCFDGYIMAEDLDEVARDMLALIDEVYSSVGDDDLFLDALEDIVQGIHSYPEWMGVEQYEGLVLERAATLCAVKWAWLSSGEDESPGKAFLERVHKMDTLDGMVELNDDACIEFFTSLPDDACREIFACLQAEDGNFNLENVYSKWHRIHHDYEQRYDTGGYLETCRAHLSKNWRYGKPLIKDALQKGDFREAEGLLERTFAGIGYARPDDKSPWYPEDSLLADRLHASGDNPSEEIAELFNMWAGVSEKLANPSRRAASEFQAVISLAPQDWDAVIYQYKSLGVPEVENVLTNLFDFWKHRMARQSVSIYVKGGFTDTWIHWLIDAQTDIDGKKAWFHNEIRGWLDRLTNNAGAFQTQWEWLARFTQDIGGAALEKQCPVFYKTVLPGDHDSTLERFRQKALENVEAGQCLTPATNLWKKRLAEIIPDPANASKSEYTRHASWMKALRELNPDGYRGLLSRWREIHRRRRNLWRDMKTAGLPV